MILRDYQQTCSDMAIAKMVEKPGYSGLVVLPTGTGKTVLFCDIANRMSVHGRVLVIVGQTNLVHQTAKKIWEVTGVEPGIEQAEFWSNEHSANYKATFVVASVQTLTGKSERIKRFDPRTFSLILIDEAHHARASSWQKVVHYFRHHNPSIPLIGFTATPERGDRRALGRVFTDGTMYSMSLLEGIRGGWLVPLKVYEPVIKSLDLSWIKPVAGELHQGQLDEEMTKAENLAAYAGITLKEYQGKKTVVFCQSVKQAKALAEMINDHEHGAAQYVSHKCHDRHEKMEAHKTGDAPIICNVGILVEGYDDPGIEKIVLASKTSITSRWIQKIGRVTRPLPGTVDGLLSPDERTAAIAASAKPFGYVIDPNGECGRHKIASFVDIFAGADEDGELRARLSGKTCDGDGEMESLVEEVRHEIREEEAARARAMVSRIEYEIRHHDVETWYGLPKIQIKHWPMKNYSTPAQVAVLVKNGIDRKYAENLSKGQAGQIIDKIYSRPSPKQALILIEHGYNPNDFDRRKATDKLTEIFGK